MRKRFIKINLFLYILFMKYITFQSFIFRVPSLSFSFLDGMLNDKELLRLPNSIQEAIYISSPILYSELQKLVNGEINTEIEKERILLSLSRYVSRMSTRCTPFGLFAGCGVGTIGDQTSIILDESAKRVTRLDNYFLSSLFNTLTQKEEVRKRLKYFPNTSLYRIGKKYRFIEIKYTFSGRKYRIVEVDYSASVNNVLKVAQRGEYIETMIEMLISEGVSSSNAQEYIQELIDSQILLPELSQAVIGDDLFQRIINLIQSIDQVDLKLLKNIRKIKETLSLIDLELNTQNLYQKIINILKDLSLSYDEKYLFQVDRVSNTIFASIGNNIVEELKSTVTFLNKLTLPYNNEKLKQFQKRFYSRYEDREVPLLEALDPEIGLGYPFIDGTLSPLLDGLELPQYSHEKIEINNLQLLLYQKVIESRNNNKLEIELTDKDVEDYNPNWDDLPPTINTLFEIIQADSNSLLIKLKACGGSSAANLIARFAHIDKKIEQFVREITKKEQELTQNTILAEIVHSPESRTGNILFRPHIREHELLFLSSTDLPHEQIILLSDILLSVRRNRLILRSKRLNKEIIPRLTSAHNYHYGTLSIYRFLSDMQVQTGRDSLFFSWGLYLESKLSFLPRVRYKNTILSLSTWIIKIDEIRSLFVIKNEKLLIVEIEKWRENRFLPQYTLMTDGDNELFVDWCNLISINSLFSIIKKRKEIRLTEFLFDSDAAIVRDTNNKPYINECIVAFYKNNS